MLMLLVLPWKALDVAEPGAGLARPPPGAQQSQDSSPILSVVPQGLPSEQAVRALPVREPTPLQEASNMTGCCCAVSYEVTAPLFWVLVHPQFCLCSLLPCLVIVVSCMSVQGSLEAYSCYFKPPGDGHVTVCVFQAPRTSAKGRGEKGEEDKVKGSGVGSLG